jgi:hypothetical protein
MKWLVPPLLGQTGATSIVAPGGSTKSLMALAVAATVASGRAAFLQMPARVTGPVVYLDWEADADTHNERLAALCKGRGVPVPDNILYRREAAPLYRTARSLAKQINREGAVLVVVDSVMLARQGEAAAEDTIRFFAGLRQLEVPALLVDHKSKEAIQKKQKGPFGSIINENSIRLMWEITAVDVHGPDRLKLKMEQTKRNNVGRLMPVAFDVQFTNEEDLTDTVSFQRIDPASIRVFTAAEGTTMDRIESALYLAGAEGMTVKEIAEELEISDGTARARCNDLEKAERAKKRDTGGAALRWFIPERDDQKEAFVEPRPDPF